MAGRFHVEQQQRPELSGRSGLSGWLDNSLPQVGRACLALQDAGQSAGNKQAVQSHFVSVPACR